MSFYDGGNPMFGGYSSMLNVIYESDEERAASSSCSLAFSTEISPSPFNHNKEYDDDDDENESKEEEKEEEEDDDLLVQYQKQYIVEGPDFNFFNSYHDHVNDEDDVDQTIQPTVEKRGSKLSLLTKKLSFTGLLLGNKANHNNNNVHHEENDEEQKDENEEYNSKTTPITKKRSSFALFSSNNMVKF